MNSAGPTFLSLRSDLLDEAKKLENPEIHPGTHIPAFETKQWTSGITDLTNHPKYSPIANDLQSEYQQVKADWKVATQEYSIKLGSADRMIVGFKIESYWSDATNGSFKIRNSPLLQSEMEFEAKTDTWRGCNWGVTVFTVDKLLYQRS